MMTQTEAIEAIDTHTGGVFSIRSTGHADGAWFAELSNPELDEVVGFAFIEDHGRIAPMVDWY